jgi:aminopeptidase N
VLKATQYGVPTRARRAAVSALPLLSEGRRVREHLESVLDDRDPYLRISAVSALKTLGDSKARGALRRHLERELDGRVARRAREAARDLGQTQSEYKKLSDEFDSVKSELAELKTRLIKLEVKTGEVEKQPSLRGVAKARKKRTTSAKKTKKTVKGRRPKKTRGRS